MKKLLSILASALLVLALSTALTGCGSDTDTSGQTITSDLGNSIGSASSSISGFGGYIEIDLALKYNTSIDENSFLIVHKIDAQNYKLYSPSVLNNGSIMFVQEDIVIRPNESGATQEHTIEIVYYINSAKQIYTFTVFQATEQSAADAIGSEAVSEYVLLNPPVIP